MAARERQSTLAPDVEARALAAWREHDVTRSIHATDRDAIRATELLRALVLDRLASEPPSHAGAPPQTPPHRRSTTRFLPVGPLHSSANDPARDLYNACAQLGRLLEGAGASPSLAVTTMDGAAQALDAAGVAYDASRLAAARASVAEGYVAAATERERARAGAAWEYPACAARLDATTAAIVAGATIDDDALGDWAARVAVGASRDGVREVVLAGPERACAELADALALVGVGVRDRAAKKTPWLRLPWRRKPAPK